jgi:hypothetical protein
MAKEISYLDMTISVSVWSGEFHVQCGSFDKKMSAYELAELIYPAVKAAASAPPVDGPK